MMVIVNSVIAILITGFGSVIAYQQYLLNKQTVKLDSQKVKWELFEKRYRVYNLTKEILLKLTQDNAIDIIKLRDYNFSIRERVFLFENDINEYIQTIINNGINITNSTEKLKREIEFPQGTEKWKELNKSNLEVSKWFSFEYQENVENRFLRYLNFQNLL